MGNRASIIFLNKTKTKEYLNNQEEFTLNTGDKYIYTHWNGGVESVCAFVDFARFLGMKILEIDKKYIEFYAMLRNFFYEIDNYYEYGIFGKYGRRYGTIELETLDCDVNVNEGLFFNNKPCVISNDFEIISYTEQEQSEARASETYQDIYNGLKKQYAKIETEICESVIDGRKLADKLGVIQTYEWYMEDSNCCYPGGPFSRGVVLVNNLKALDEYYNQVEYDEEHYTKENIDAVCIMLEKMQAFCNERQIKYINLN